jgi:hypothetical protein
MQSNHTRHTLPLMATTAIGILLLACGGGGGSGTSSTPPVVWSQSPAGIWHGYSTPDGGSAETVVGASDSQGRFQFYSLTKGSAISAQATATGSGATFTGSGLIQLENEKTPRTMSFSYGSVTGSTNFSCRWTIPSVGINGGTSVNYDSLYDRTVTLEDLAGTYSDGTRTVHISGDTISGTGASGPFTGTIGVVTSGKNLFSITFTQGTETLSGMAFWSDGSSAHFDADSLYCQWSNSEWVQGAILAKQP